MVRGKASSAASLRRSDPAKSQACLGVVDDSDGSGWATGNDDVESDIVEAICHKCKKGDKPEKMLLCDTCDRGWHLYCLTPPLKSIPEGDWSCPKCVDRVSKQQLASDPRGWLAQTVEEEEVCGYESAECDDLDADSAPDALDLQLTQGGRDELHQLSNSWELASVVHFLGIFGVKLALTDASQPITLSALAKALSAEDAASDSLLATLHTGLLACTNVTRAVPLDEYWWPTWLARWVKRRNTNATEREGKPLSFFQGCTLQEQEHGVGGSNYNALTPLERLELLHQLCCDRLESKRSLVISSTDAGVDDDVDAHGVDADHAGGNEGASNGSASVPASWRPGPKATDAKGRHYWYFPEAKGLQACLFRSTRFRTAAGRAVRAEEECSLSEVQAQELWADCMGDDDPGAASSEEEDAAPEDKCQVCDSGDDHHKLMLCDMCDEAYHTYCLRPVLKYVPSGEWACPRCDVQGGHEAPDKYTTPVSRGIANIETTVNIFWESYKKGETDGLVMERIVTRRPKKAIGGDGRTFDVHYTYRRTGKSVPKKSASGIFRSLPEVHRYLNSLWLLAEEHLGRFDFSCCYGADGSMTDLGKERAAAATAVKIKGDAPSSRNDTQKARAQETEKRLRRWRLCGWPCYETSKSPGGGRWETLSVDLKTLEGVKRCIDARVVPPVQQRDDAHPAAQGMPVNPDSDSMAADGAARQDELANEKRADEDTDRELSIGGALQATDDTVRHAVGQISDGKANLVPAAEGQGADVIENVVDTDPALIEVSQLAGKVLSDAAAEQERRRRAEELRRLAEAEAARKKERIRRQLGESAVSASNIVTEGGFGRRARKVVNYAEAERESDRQLRKYINHVEFGKGKYKEDSSEDEGRSTRRRVTRRVASPPPRQESREERLARRTGERKVESDDGPSRPRRAAALAGAYGERRLSSSDSDGDEWESDASDGKEEEDVAEESEGNDWQDARDRDIEANGALGAFASRETPRKRKHLAEDEDENQNQMQEEREEDGADGTPEEKAGNCIGDVETQGMRLRLGADDQVQGEAPVEGVRAEEVMGSEVGPEEHVAEAQLEIQEPEADQDQDQDQEEVEASYRASIASLVRDRERASWLGRRVVKNFPGFGRFGGRVESYSKPTDNYQIVFSDGDIEHLDYEKMKSLVVDDSDESLEEGDATPGAQALQP